MEIRGEECVEDSAEPEEVVPRIWLGNRGDGDAGGGFSLSRKKIHGDFAPQLVQCVLEILVLGACDIVECAQPAFEMGDPGGGGGLVALLPAGASPGV